MFKSFALAHLLSWRLEARHQDVYSDALELALKLQLVAKPVKGGKMKKIIFGFIISIYGFSSSAEMMYRLGDKPPAFNLTKELAKMQAENDAILAYAGKYPRECFEISYPVSQESRTVVTEDDNKVVYDDGTTAYKLMLLHFDDRTAARFAPIWYDHDGDSRIVFRNNEQRCIESRESFQSDFEFSDELIAHIGADKSILSPGHLKFLRNAKMYESVSGNDYMERYNAIINQ